MKRRVRTLLVFLLLGAIVNVAVAWGLCATRGIGHQRSGQYDDLSRMMLNHWDAYRSAQYTDRPDGGFEAHYLGFASAALGVGNTPAEPLVHEMALIHVAGLPAPSLIGCRFERRVEHSGGSAWKVDVNTLIPVRKPDRTTRTRPIWLPLRPLWPGFALNTLFYAGLLWMLFAAAFALRRRLRIKRGLCPTCAYPVGASDVCTECGAKLPSPSR